MQEVQESLKKGRKKPSSKLIVVGKLSPTSIKEEAEGSVQVQPNSHSQDPGTIGDENKKQKRGRKPKLVYNAVEVSSNVSTVAESDEENIIVKLNIKDANVDEPKYEDDEVPYAYNHSYYSAISSVDVDDCLAPVNAPQQQQTTTLVTNNLPQPRQDTNKRMLKVIDLLKDFEEKNKVNEWPSNTTVVCYWCCHKFDTPPLGIPVQYNQDQFQVFGCFCSLECASAYNFKQNHNLDEMWERNNLIHLLSRRMNYEAPVKPAPDRLALKLFGGYMEIEQFRGYTTMSPSRFVNLNFPPMNSITQQLEEINEYDLKNDMKFIPLDNERIKKYKEKVLFKRNKPLIDSKNSIESTMNLRYNTG